MITETAWHSLFARNMFRVPPQEALRDFEPDFTVLQLPGLRADPETDGTRSPTAVVLDLEARKLLICGTSYAGEIKKSIFGVLNYLLPEQDVFPMHCSANVGERGDVALFFGLSGTGKTTLSADPERTLIGDDEHGWGPAGVFNFEGGCYAKVIRLSTEDEPEIHAASTRFGAILENVVVDPLTGVVDFADDRLTENTRASYPLDFIANASPTGMADHPGHIVMLTADAYGVLPPISKLTSEQAMYHFLSGYTARVAGTEQGVKEPQATFSTCFGAPFMPRHPTVYARMLRERMRHHAADCWLVNTGWSGGPYGTGQRIKLAHTRAMLRAALSGQLEGVAMRRHPELGLMMPEACPGVPSAILNPQATWADAKAYDHKARELVKRFEVNFKPFAAARRRGGQGRGDPRAGVDPRAPPPGSGTGLAYSESDGSAGRISFPWRARSWSILASLLGRFLNSGPAAPRRGFFPPAARAAGCSLAGQALPSLEAGAGRARQVPAQGVFGAPGSASGAPSTKVCQANQ